MNRQLYMQVLQSLLYGRRTKEVDLAALCGPFLVDRS